MFGRIYLITGENEDTFHEVRKYKTLNVKLNIYIKTQNEEE